MSLRNIKPLTWTISAVVIIALLIWVLPKSGSTEEPNKASGKSVENQSVRERMKQLSQSDVSEGGKKTASGEQSARNLQSLQALMDEVDENEQEALALAKKMIERREPEEKIAAAYAFEWIGGKESIGTLISKLDEGDKEVKAVIVNALHHTMQTSEIDQTYEMTAADWQELFAKLPQEEDYDQFMTLLCSHSAEYAVPILLDLARKSNEAQAAAALANIGSFAEGAEFKNVREAEAWFKNYCSREKE